MEKNENLLFVTSRPSRNSELQISAEQRRDESILEREWAEKLGLDLANIVTATVSTTGSPEVREYKTSSRTKIGTAAFETEEGSETDINDDVDTIISEDDYNTHDDDN